MADDNSRQLEWWDYRKYPEVLEFTSISDAVEAWADSFSSPLEVRPDHKLTVYGFSRFRLPEVNSLADSILQDTLERLDEEYSHEDNEGLNDSAGRVAGKARELAEAILDNFTVTAAELVETRKVRAGDYLDSEWFGD